MTRRTVVEMGTVREFLAQLEQLKSELLAGEIQGWGGVVKFADGRDVVYVGGSFRTSTADRTRAMLRVSAAVALRQDDYLPPPKMVTVQ